MFLYKIVTNLCNILVKILFRLEVRGIENIPEEGRCIIACNHKSNWDAVVLASLFRKRKACALAKKELFKNALFGKLLRKLSIIPVDREKPSISTIKEVLSVLKREEVLIIFPEGTRHKDKNSFADVKAGVGMFAIKGKSSIVPISLISDYKLFKKMIIHIDNPILVDGYEGKKLVSNDYEDLSNEVMDVIKYNYFKNI